MICISNRTHSDEKRDIIGRPKSLDYAIQLILKRPKECTRFDSGLMESGGACSPKFPGSREAGAVEVSLITLHCPIACHLILKEK